MHEVAAVELGTVWELVPVLRRGPALVRERPVSKVRGNIGQMLLLLELLRTVVELPEVMMVAVAVEQRGCDRPTLQYATCTQWFHVHFKY